MKPILHFIAWIGLVGTSFAQSSPPRTALVMGVGDYGGATYKGKTIPNLPGITTADVPQMAKKLKALGFTVTEVSNPTLSEAKSAVDAFSAKIKAQPGVSLFYFSGHGGEYEGKNFLIPKKATIGSKADLADEALSAQRVLNGMEESGAEVNLVFLDCCREDLGKSVGGAEMAPLKAKGSFIGFATRSGDFADPGEEGSPYTRFLLKHMDKPGISVADMYAIVIGDVKKFSKEKLGEERRPGYYSELDAPFYFVPTGSGVFPGAVATMPKVDPVPTNPATESAPLPVNPSVDPLDNPKNEAGKGLTYTVNGPDGEVKWTMRSIPSGSFMMGSPSSEEDRSRVENGADGKPVRVTFTKPFWMGETEVTQSLYSALMGQSVSNWKSYMEKQKGMDEYSSAGGASAGPNQPMYFVSAIEADAFITRLNQKVNLGARWKWALPREAQWEYACRGGASSYSVFSFGNTLNGTQANCIGWLPYPNGTTKGKDLESTCDVGSFTANGWGLKDMHGNVREWCLDAWNAMDGLPGGNNPLGADGTYRVTRGGDWHYPASACRSADRYGVSPWERDSWIGFRVAAVPADE